MKAKTKITVEAYAEVKAMHLEGVSAKAIAERTGITLTAVYRMLRGKWTPPADRVRKEYQRFRRPDWQRQSGRRQRIDPTPEEIAAACEAIRADWSDEEYAIRAIGESPWTAPIFAVSELAAA